MTTTISSANSRKLGKAFTFSVWVILSYFSTTVSAQEFRNYYITDAVGSPVASTDSDANRKWSEDYLPYGGRVVQASYASTDGDNERWFTGALQNEVSGLSYLGDRYYDPVVGRFISIDPLPPLSGAGGHFNLYWYGSNNPYYYLDPSGRENAFWEWLDRFNNPFSHSLPSTESFQSGTRQLMYGDPYPRMDFTEELIAKHTASNFKETARATAKVGDLWVSATLIMLGEAAPARGLGAARGIGLSTEIANVTRAGSRYTNIAAKVSATEFQSNLLANGYKVVKQINGSNGPVTILTNGEKTYTIYTATSTGSASAQATNAAGEILSKIRLAGP